MCWDLRLESGRTNEWMNECMNLCRIVCVSDPIHAVVVVLYLSITILQNWSLVNNFRSHRITSKKPESVWSMSQNERPPLSSLALFAPSLLLSCYTHSHSRSLFLVHGGDNNSIHPSVRPSTGSFIPHQFNPIFLTSMLCPREACRVYYVHAIIIYLERLNPTQLTPTSPSSPTPPPLLASL